MEAITEAEEYCSQREDQTHCVHWWDGEPCCSCGSNEGEIDGEEPDGSP